MRYSHKEILASAGERVSELLHVTTGKRVHETHLPASQRMMPFRKEIPILMRTRSLQHKTSRHWPRRLDHRVGS